MSDKTIYRVVAADRWLKARHRGAYEGESHDLSDGFIHLSAGHQVAGTLAKHYPGRENLVLLEIDAANLGDALIWETSRGGELFPHLYGRLSAGAVKATHPLPLDDDGRHVTPPPIRR